MSGYGADSPLAKVRIGYIADEVNPALMWDNTIDQVSVNGILMASIRELNLKISDLSKGQIASPVNTFTNTLGQYASLSAQAGAFFSDVVTKVESGVAYMKALVVDTLKIGSPTKRTGITLYDEVNGEPYCISVANGVTKTTAGECKVIESTTPPPTEAPLLNQGGKEPHPQVRGAGVVM